MRKLIQAFLTTGKANLPSAVMATFAEIKQLLGLDDVLGLCERLEGTEPSRPGYIGLEVASCGYTTLSSSPVHGACRAAV